MKRDATTAALLLCAAFLTGCDTNATGPEVGEFDLQPSVSSAPSTNSGFAVGQVTPRGGWVYDWNNTIAQWGRLSIVEPSRWLDDIACSDRPTDCGGFTGRSGQRRAFVHIYVASERIRRATRPVLLFAWGDDAVFEAVVLADTPDNRRLFSSTVALNDVEAAIAVVQELAADPVNDVIRGRTRLSNYYGVLNPPLR